MNILSEAETVAEGATGTWWIKLLPYALSIAAVLGLLYGAYSWAYHRGAHSRDPEVAALTLTIANMKAASAQAHADNLAHVAAIETHDAQATKDASDAIAAQSAAADDAVSRYIRLHPAPKADPGYAGAGSLPQVADASSGVAQASGDTVVYADDLRICAANTIAAQGWLAWWEAVSVGQ